jgi:hypothetical protein
MKLVALFFILALGARSPVEAPAPGAHRQLGRFEEDAGWTQLFDGASTAGWRGIGADAFPSAGWEVSEGCLHRKAGERGGDLVTTREFGDFELEFEWRVAPGANSGLKYRVRDEPGLGAAFGPEYQVLDDGAHENGASPKTSAGALYDVAAALKSAPPLVGGFNRARIVARGARIEHWLNGERLVDVELGSTSWAAQIADSKFKGRTDFASPGPGRIALQDHGDEVWFRNLRLRELPAWGAPEVLLYDGESLDNWRQYGDAIYAADGDSILGRVGGGGQSFLISEETFGDFVLEVDVKTEEPGNSGIQIRSHEQENGRPFGYQIEIDPSSRAWTGGLYDEDRRGWLQDLEANPAGRAAFEHQGWNRFRIECVGPWIKTWVNGVAVTDYFDTADLEGFIALQVHSGNNTRVRWRAPRLWDLGRRPWLSIFDGESLSNFELRSGQWSVVKGSVVGRAATDEPACIALPRALRSIHFAGGRGVLDLECWLEGAQGVELGVRLKAGSVAWHMSPATSGFRCGEWNSLSIGTSAERTDVSFNGKTTSWPTEFASAVDIQLELHPAPSEVRLRNIRVLGEAEPRHELK